VFMVLLVKLTLLTVLPPLGECRDFFSRNPGEQERIVKCFVVDLGG
jgi:hypothetical protein